MGAVEGGGTRCVRGMVLVLRRACAGALVVVGDGGGGEEARRGKGGRLAGLRGVSEGWRGEGVAAAAAAAATAAVAVEAVVEGVGAGSCEGASRWVEGLLARCACDRMRLAALSIRKFRRAQVLSVCV